MNAKESTTMEYPIGETDSQTQRLVTQAQLYDPSTRAFFRSAGIGRGMKVLELGSGVGDVTLLLAELVGPSGRITGVELQPRAGETARARVRAAGWRNVEIVVGNIEDAQLEQDFDAAVGRFVLMWLPDPRAVLKRVADHLHPGGIVAFQDNDFAYSMGASKPLPLFDKVMTVMSKMQSQGGPDFHMGLKMHQLYRDAGIPTPQLTLDAPLGTGSEWTGYQFIAETVQMLLPRMTELGVSMPPDLNLSSLEGQLRREAVENNAVIVLPAIIGAWSRKQQVHPI